MKQLASSCEAAICVKHNKVKNSNGTVYLQDKTEFEIELFNPTQSTKLAKIQINGKYISTSGIVVRPGARIYLERYIDVPKKFLFDVYEVEDTKAVAEAIAKNGIVRVEWYDEIIPKQNDFPFFQTSGTLRLNQLNQQDLLNDYYKRINGTGNPTPNVFTTTNVNLNNLADGSLNSTFTTSVNNVMRSSTPKSFFNNSAATMDWMSMAEEPTMKETGRVEAGSKSKQSFVQYNGEFERWSSYNVEIKLLPLSQKPIEAKDLASYCTECGSKNKKNWKFCPTCGNKY